MMISVSHKVPVDQCSTSRCCRHHGVTCYGRARWPQRLHEGDEGGHLLRRQVLAIGWHIAPALYYLPDQLITGQAGGDTVERRAAHAAFTAQTVTVSALLVL